MRNGRAIGPLGTAGRVALGVVFFFVVLHIPEGGALTWTEVALGLFVSPAALIAFQVARLRWTTERLDATGPGGFVVNFTIGAVLFSTPFLRDATFMFAGTSLFLAAVRGYAGCELLAISNYLLRRDDEVGCVVFSPLDGIEAQATRAAGHNRERARVSRGEHASDAVERERRIAMPNHSAEGPHDD